MSKPAAILAGVLVLALVAGGLTEATLAYGRRASTSDDVLLRPGLKRASAVSPRPDAKPAATPKPTPSATVTATPATPEPTPAGPTATTNSFVHLRASASTSSAILYNLDGGIVVQLLPYSDSLWQEVQYNGITGYIYKAYLTY